MIRLVAVPLFVSLALVAAAGCNSSASSSAERADGGFDIVAFDPSDAGGVAVADSRHSPDAGDASADSVNSGPAVDADTGDVERTIGDLPFDFGAPCASGAECTTGICVETELGRACSAFCEGRTCAAPGWSCGELEIDGATSASVCLPPDGLMCLSCGDSEDCPGGGCVPHLDGDRCTPACGPGECPAGFTCGELGYCVADDNVCTAACIDADGDARGVGSCLDLDCDDTDASVFPGAPEACDGIDNDCDGAVDEDVLNDCGGCGPLAGSVGSECGNCGVWTCDGSGGVRCEDEAPNACGGCGPTTYGETCGACGTVVCGDAPGYVECEDPGYNACGGCDPLAAAPGDACGACGGGTYVCTAEGTLRCDDDGVVNACGGCSTLGEVPGSPCGQCPGEEGVWECFGPDRLTCSSRCALYVDNDVDRLKIDAAAFRFNDGTSLSTQASGAQGACVVLFAQGERTHGVEYRLVDSDADGWLESHVLPPIRTGLLPYMGATFCDPQSLSARFNVVKCGSTWSDASNWLSIGGENDPRAERWIFHGADDVGNYTWSLGLCRDATGTLFPCGKEASCLNSHACGHFDPHGYSGRACAETGLGAGDL